VTTEPSRQHTLAAPAIFAGVGLHSGLHVRVAIRPAPAGAGVVFVRTDLPGDNLIPCRGDMVSQTRLNTVVSNEAGASVSTVEHLMAALAALSIDNAIVELDGPEVPIMDGSAEPFVQLLDRAGRRRQEAERRYIEVLEPIEVVDGDKRAALLPSPAFEIFFEIEFDSRVIGRQQVDLVVDEESFRTELSDCRTFGFVHEVEALRRVGLARGGSLDNAVVIDGDEILNAEGLRRPDEFVRHKALDAVGDLHVLGQPLLARFEGVKAGHALNNLVVRALLERPDAWRLRTLDDGLAEAV
jgi:UDP-3-O-[3-hydroxymyristoyl] N-acetylglucosamine deacetylase